MKDVDNKNGNDTIVLKFDRPVKGAEKGDFRLEKLDPNTAATQATLSSDGKELTLVFNEAILGNGNSAKVHYDRSFASTAELTDLIGSKIISFTVTATK